MREDEVDQTSVGEVCLRCVVSVIWYYLWPSCKADPPKLSGLKQLCTQLREPDGQQSGWAPLGSSLGSYTHLWPGVGWVGNFAGHIWAAHSLGPWLGPLGWLPCIRISHPPVGYRRLNPLGQHSSRSLTEAHKASPGLAGNWHHLSHHFLPAKARHLATPRF